MDPKRLTILAGHYGSGKTNIAVNLALELSKSHPVAIGDLDIVNPYYRTKDSLEQLQAAGIEVIASKYANSNLDIPALPSEFYRLTEDHRTYAVLDIGGDDQGAVALARFVPKIIEENNYDFLFVANFSRPLTLTPQAAMEVLREIEQACGLAFTGIINNTNLGCQTDANCILASHAKVQALCELAQLPLILTTIEASFADELTGKIPNLLPMTLQKRPV